MKQSVNFTSLKRSFGIFFERYHLMLFFVLIGLGLAVSLIMIVDVIHLSSQTNSSDVTPINQAFDEVTAKKLETIDASNAPPTSSGGRINPFVE